MEYELVLAQWGRYLHAHITDTSLDRPTALGYLAELAGACADKRCKHLILERNAPVTLAEADLHSTVAQFVHMSTGVRVAFLNQYEEASGSLRDAVNTGAGMGADFKCFIEKADAEDWLAGD
jgi:hypothetical protein